MDYPEGPAPMMRTSTFEISSKDISRNKVSAIRERANGEKERTLETIKKAAGTKPFAFMVAIRLGPSTRSTALSLIS